jgi:pyruvate dehydrogenase E2 component (dihydrolipoamide acetyltransferase)
MSVLLLPDLGEGLQKAEIVSWHVNVGDHVVTSQPLVAVETDKAVVEVPAPHAGTIKKLCAEVGEAVDVGAPLVEFEEGDAVDTGTVVGNLQEAPTESHTERAPSSTMAGSATPRVRALARELGVELGAVTGTGPDGAILSKDVEAAAAAAPAGNKPERLRGVRLAMAERMAKAHAEVVPASIHDDADVHHWPEHTDVTFKLVKAIAHACTKEPALNCWLDMEKETRQLHDHVDLGIAVDTADGLFVPTLRNVGQRDAESIRAGMERLKQDVLNRSIPPSELRGQTITLSNFGTIGGRYAELVVVPPQVAIVGAGRVEPAVLAEGDALAVRRRLPLSLSFDHRAVTGAEAARFLAAIIEHLEQPLKQQTEES